MKQRLGLVIAGYFVVIGIILAAVLPFAVDVLHRATLLQRHLNPAQVNAARLEAAAVDQETGERGYVITGDPDYLEPWNSGRRAAAEAFTALENLDLTKRERSALAQANDDLTKWQGEAQREIAATNRGELTVARQDVSSGHGKFLFDRFRRRQRDFVTLVQGRVDSQRRALHRNAVFAIVALALASFVGVVSALVLRGWARMQTRHDEQQLREQLAFAELHRMTAGFASLRTAREVATAAVTDVGRLLDAAIVRLWTDVRGDRIELAAEHVAEGYEQTTLRALSLSENAPLVEAHNAREALFFGTREEVSARYPGWAPTWARQRAEAVAVLPLQHDEGTLGVLLVWYREAQTFDDQQRTLLALVADNVGAAYERARTREREHDAALKLQESLLGPAAFLEGVGHALRYLPAEPGFEVGGDWHNAQRLPDGRFLVAIGDVVGRGIDAATTMGQLRSCVSACATRCATPADLLDCVDDFVRSLPGAQGTTLALAYVDVVNARLEYLCAGHPPPVLVDPEGHAQLLDEGLSWPLGIDEPRPAGIGAGVPFPPGSLLLLYTDGLIERRRASLDVGIAQLTRSAEAHCFMPLEAMCDALLADAFDGHRREDDVAVLALRTPVSSPRMFLAKEPAKPSSIALVRGGLREWMRPLGLSDADQTALLVAVGEACTNAVEHAGTSARAFFRVEAVLDDRDVLVSITDNGAWKDNPDRTARGNGLAIMRELMDDVRVEPRSSGTAVTLRLRSRSLDERVVLA